MGASCPKAHFPKWRQGFFLGGRGDRTERPREAVEKLSPCRRAQCILVRTVTAQCVSSWSSHPGFTLSMLYPILAPRLKISKAPGTGRPEGRGLYLSKSVPGIPTQPWCSSASCIVSQSLLSENGVRRMVGWVTTPAVTVAGRDPVLPTSGEPFCAAQRRW